MSERPKFAVLGAGNGGVATAADLTVRGFEVHLWEMPEFASSIKSLQEAGGVDLDVLPGTGLTKGFANIKMITTDLKMALDGVDVVMVIVPAFAHRTFAELCAPYLQDNQVVIICPGNFGGAMSFYQIFKKKGTAKNVVFAEGECMIYACRKKSPTEIWIRGYKRGFRIAAFPAKYTDKVMNLIKEAYPDCKPGNNVIETGLSNPNMIIHTPIMTMNAALIDRTKGDFLFYHEGCTPIVGTVIEALDAERLAIGKALKTGMRSCYEQDCEWYGDQGAVGKNIYETSVNNGLYKWSKAPDSFQNRYLTEDIPYGLVAVEKLGKFVGVPTPIATSLINLSELLVGKELRSESKSFEELGIADLSIDEIVKFVNEGE